MDRNDSSSTSSSSITTANSNMFLKQPNRNSLKISKPLRKPIPPLEPKPQFPGRAPPPPSHHPAVYNINKNDFRDVVQKLTGSPAHERQQTPPPPIASARPPSSRLQRIRPPPLSQVGNRPGQPAQIHHHRPQFDSGQRPPFPQPHPAAESPISAYMRFLQTSASPRAPPPPWNGGPRPEPPMPQNEIGQRPPPPPFSPLQPVVSPASSYTRFLQSSGAQPPPQPQFAAPPQPRTPTNAFPPMPLSPLPFGCVPSPRSPYGMMSPGFLFAPMGHHLGFPQLPPLSPTFPIPSPRWKGI